MFKKTNNNKIICYQSIPCLKLFTSVLINFNIQLKLMLINSKLLQKLFKKKKNRKEKSPLIFDELFNHRGKIINKQYSNMFTIYKHSIQQAPVIQYPKLFSKHYGLTGFQDNFSHIKSMKNC